MRRFVMIMEIMPGPAVRRGKAMRLRRSFIAKIFSVVLLCLIILLVIESVGIYEYSRQTVGNEFVRLNQEELSQLASSMGRNMSSVRNYGEKVSVNSRLLELVMESGEEAQAEAHAIVQDLQAEYNNANMNGSSRMETYIAGKGGLFVSSYNTNAECYTWEALSGDSRLEPLFSGEADMVMFPTARNEDMTGIMKYSFQMVFAMRGFWEESIRGLVVVDVSELFLFSQYKSYTENGVWMAVMEPDGRIVSDSGKSGISTYYQYTEDQLENIAGYENVNDKILDGKLHFYKRINGTDWLLVKQVEEDEVFAAITALLKRMLLSFLLYGVLAAVVITAAARMFLRRVLCIKDNMKRVTDGDLTTRIEVKKKDEFGEIEASFNTMVAEMDNLIGMIRQREQQKRIAEMDFMYAQINSHFIQNTLTSIRFMLEMGKDKEAEEMLFYFSKLLRQTLSRSDEFITLRQELDILSSYVGLQSYRYQNQFEVSYEVEESVMECKVLRLILQPVLENAIFYNVGHAPVHICIRAHREEDKLILAVEDDGVGMSREIRDNVLKKDVKLNHVGLRNVHERIQLYFGKEYGITILSQEGNGTKVIFSMPTEKRGIGQNETECGCGG